MGNIATEDIMTSTALAEAFGGAPVLGESIDSPLGWVEALERGLPTAALEAVVERGVLSRAEAEEFVVPRRTLSHRKLKGQRLTLEESDRLGRIVRLTVRAAETLGSEEDAVAWLREPNGALAGQAPLELLRSGEGAVLVEQVLTRIDHGVHT
jgi:putative toxin-antitoxin system antitoxin component (TIGR02293 family)